jgi:hypothetical protein
VAKVRSINGEDISMQTAEVSEESNGVRLVTILYSLGRDVYRVPTIDKGCWLSVAAYELPPKQLAIGAFYLGPSISADGKHWRKTFSTDWKFIVAGDPVTVPVSDPMVVDYAACQACQEK